VSRKGFARRQPEVYPLGTGFIPLTWSRLWGVPAIRSPWALAACISRAARPAERMCRKANIGGRLSDPIMRARAL
jgi:hypothetical protein